MNQDETAWLRKIIFLSIAILAAVLSVARVKPVFAQVTPANFDTVDHYIIWRRSLSLRIVGQLVDMNAQP